MPRIAESPINRLEVLPNDMAFYSNGTIKSFMYFYTFSLLFCKGNRAWNSFDTTRIFWDFMFFIHQTVNWVDVCAGLKYLRDLPIHFINTNVNCEVGWFLHPLTHHFQCGKSFDVCLTSFSFLIWTLIL